MAPLVPRSSFTLYHKYYSVNSQAYLKIHGKLVKIWYDESMKTKIFIDFDGTLFDTGKYRAFISSTFKKFGFDQAEIDQTYRQECEDYRYDPYGQAERICRNSNCDLSELKHELSQLGWNAKECLYDDSEEFLLALDRNLYEINMLTLGDMYFQKDKVDHSGIGHFFDHIYYCEVQKWEYLDKLVQKNEKFIVIDDRPDALENISRLYPNSICIKMTRSDNADAADPVLDIRDDYVGPHVSDMFGAVKYLPQE